MSKLSRKAVRKLVIEAILSSDGKEKSRKSEMSQFAKSKSGEVVQREGQKMQGCSEVIKKVADDQTGAMRETLEKLAEFVNKTGTCLAGMGTLNEGESMLEGMPTLSELKELHKNISRLEK